jgi:Fe2+ transport system protein FeoA
MSAQSLDTVPSGSTVRVVSLGGGRHAREKLMGLGIVPGEKVRVRKNENGGPLIIDIYGSKTVLGLGLAQKVQVMVVGSDSRDT